MAEGNTRPIEKDCFYFCLDCKRKMRQEKAIDFQLFLSLEPSFICSSCGERFEIGYSGKKRGEKDPSGKKRREKDPSGKKRIQTRTYLCDVCGEMLVNERSTALLCHSYRHSGKWPYRCSYCNKGFPYPSHWKQHMETRDSIREIRCLECLKRFRGKYCPGALASLEGRIYCESCSTGSSPIEYIPS
ncbi:hypothetical protein TNIN_188901 [Trichonephila inaurata madagascariensis]|uniref:C2H2-type domain-containing protein n=1 Tax=Trichonephila inaurata madagascariensis TaxID=2747483 RepID=A0A8X6YUV7_9ARAC|nr:hypothetical protein TNIN_188901 [Trichonephila inaurata madagascariensis]